MMPDPLQREWMRNLEETIAKEDARKEPYICRDCHSGDWQGGKLIHHDDCRICPDNVKITKWRNRQR